MIRKGFEPGSSYTLWRFHTGALVRVFASICFEVSSGELYLAIVRWLGDDWATIGDDWAMIGRWLARLVTGEATCSNCPVSYILVKRIDKHIVGLVKLTPVLLSPSGIYG